MVDTDIVDVRVELEPEARLVGVYRCQDAIAVRRFDCKGAVALNFFPLKLSKSRRAVDWVVPTCFAFGVLFLAWAIVKSGGVQW